MRGTFPVRSRSPSIDAAAILDQYARHIFAKLAQARAAATFARRRRIDHHTFARQVILERIALGGCGKRIRRQIE